MEELKKTQVLAHENPDLGEGFQLCKDRMKCTLRNATEAVIFEATDATCARMPTHNNPELAIEWALQEMKSPSPVWLYPGANAVRIPPHHQIQPTLLLTSSIYAW